VTAIVAVVVAGGLALAAAIGLSGGLDGVAVLLFALMAAIGALGIAAARRADREVIAPDRCARCGGLDSSDAPTCKHCGSPLPG
jgi:hypothetical protein